jgi:predicted glycosyltransferase
MRFLFYSHDGMGLGHVRRHLAIASALVKVAPGARVLLATSIDEVSNLGLPPNVDTLKLPGLRKVANNNYCSRRLGLPRRDIHNVRSALLLATVNSFGPAVILVDKHPFGAGGEMAAALERGKVCGARTVLGLRDILDDTMTVVQEWSVPGVQERIVGSYDRVLVYGDPAVFDPIGQYQFGSALRKRTEFCGYVLNPPRLSPPVEPCVAQWSTECATSPGVLGTTGGGEDGFALMETFILAAARAPWQALAVAGPLLEESKLEALQLLANNAQVSLSPFIPCLSELFSSTGCLVCMGGYNTLVEALSKGIPIVCVPRAAPRSEQLVRAETFQRLGLLEMIHPDKLNAELLRRRIESALETPREQILKRAGSVLSFDGAERAANILLGLAAGAQKQPAVQMSHLAA